MTNKCEDCELESTQEIPVEAIIAGDNLVGTGTRSYCENHKKPYDRIFWRKNVLAKDYKDEYYFNQETEQEYTKEGLPKTH